MELKVILKVRTIKVRKKVTAKVALKVIPAELCWYYFYIKNLK